MTRPRRWLGPFALLAVAPFALHAQTITVHLLNAKSGKPMPDKNITFHWVDHPDSVVVAVDKDGIGHVLVPAGVAAFIMVEGPRTGKDPHGVAYADCNANSSTEIPLAEVLAHGLAPRNVCGSKSAHPAPGEVIFWAAPRTGWLADIH